MTEKKAKYRTGNQFTDDDNNVCIIEWVYDWERFGENSRSYAYSCYIGDGMVEESVIDKYLSR